MRTIAENRSFLENYVKSLRQLKELERIVFVRLREIIVETRIKEIKEKSK